MCVENVSTIDNTVLSMSPPRFSDTLIPTNYEIFLSGETMLFCYDQSVLDQNKAPKVQMPRWNDTISTNTTINHSTNTAVPQLNWACLQCLACTAHA